jgi:hypothetical protein
MDSKEQLTTLEAKRKQTYRNAILQKAHTDHADPANEEHFTPGPLEPLPLLMPTATGLRRAQTEDYARAMLALAEDTVVTLRTECIRYMASGIERTLEVFKDGKFPFRTPERPPLQPEPISPRIVNRDFHLELVRKRILELELEIEFIQRQTDMLRQEISKLDDFKQSMDPMPRAPTPVATPLMANPSVGKRPRKETVEQPHEQSTTEASPSARHGETTEQPVSKRRRTANTAKPVQDTNHSDIVDCPPHQ